MTAPEQVVPLPFGLAAVYFVRQPPPTPPPPPPPAEPGEQLSWEDPSCPF